MICHVFFDTHAHLDQSDFAPDREEVIERASQAGVDTMVCIGVTAGSSVRVVELAQQFPSVYAAVGIQPNYVHEAGPDDWQQIVELVKQPKVVALGETGLDLYWKEAPFPLQQEYFDRHLRLSQELHLPFIVHMRECGQEILEMLQEAHQRGPLRGIMHSFTGNAALAQECLALGLHISFAGMVTYKKSTELREVAKTIPLDRLLIETDSPYLSPEPVRKIRRNEPAHIVHTATCLANARGETVEQLAEQTTANARQLFKIA